MKTRKSLIALVLLLCSVCAWSQDDLIILRDGSEMTAKVVQMDSKQLTYKDNNKRDAPTLSLDLSDIYMVRFKTRGNIYITENGKRKSGENNKWDKTADRIYLINGCEIQAYDLQVNETSILYSLHKPSKKVRPQQLSVQMQNVFMIKYTDGTKDIINNLANDSYLQTPVAAETEVAEEEEETASEEMQVVFHNVKKGDTLSSIARRYNVSTKNIIEWNSLSTKTGPKTKLQEGMQLMLYVQPAK